MSKYRIIEKKGEWISFEEGVTKKLDTKIGFTNKDGEYYLPKYEVQQEKIYITGFFMATVRKWETLQDFDNLTKAQEFKRNLELEDGIVIE